MSLAGVLAILVGWLMIMPLQRKELSPVAVARGRWRRYVLAFIGTWMLTAGMATVVQARF